MVKKRGWWWHEDAYLRELRQNPDVPEVVTTPEAVVLTRLHWKVVGHDPENPLVSGRDKRRLRTLLTSHGYRRFKPWGPNLEAARSHFFTAGPDRFGWPDNGPA